MDWSSRSVERIRRRQVSTRCLGDKVIVARPRDGSPVVLAPTAGLVWNHLVTPATLNELESLLAKTYPSVEAPERKSALVAIVDSLREDELVEPG